MTLTGSEIPAALRDVFYEFAIAHPRPDAGALETFTRRFPNYAADLTEFAIELALDAMLDLPVSDEPSPLGDDDDLSDVDIAMSRFHNRLYAVRKAAPPAGAASTAAPVANPFVGLERDQTRALARRLHANSAFVMMLRDREVDADTMTGGFRREIEDELHVPPEVLLAHFAAQAQIQGRVRFASEVKPAAKSKLSFADAVRSAGLSADQQAYLLSL
jgi:hypothetical protein